MGPFLLLIPEFPVVHNFAHGRISFWSHLNKVKIQFLGFFKRFCGWQDA
jgi:hypothetical protein